MKEPHHTDISAPLVTDLYDYEILESLLCYAIYALGMWHRSENEQDAINIKNKICDFLKIKDRSIALQLSEQEAEICAVAFYVVFHNLDRWGDVYSTYLGCDREDFLIAWEKFKLKNRDAEYIKSLL